MARLFRVKAFLETLGLQATKLNIAVPPIELCLVVRSEGLEQIEGFLTICQHHTQFSAEELVAFFDGATDFDYNSQLESFVLDLLLLKASQLPAEKKEFFFDHMLERLLNASNFVFTPRICNYITTLFQNQPIDDEQIENMTEFLKNTMENDIRVDKYKEGPKSLKELCGWTIIQNARGIL
jgi:hypothetical protein